MSGINANVRNFINNIRNDVEVESNLSDLKVALTGLNSHQLVDLARESQLNYLFDCLNSSNRNQILITCDVLKLFLPSLSASHLLSQYGTSLNRALTHPYKEVKETVLKELIRCVGSDAMMALIHQESDLLPSAATCLCDEDTSVGCRAVDFFINLGKTKNGLQSICQPAIIRQLINNVGNNNIYAIRVFEVLIDIGVSSIESLKFLENEGLLDRLSTFLSSDDVLSMLALLEVCTKLAITDHGFDFLSRHNVIKNLVLQLASYNDCPAISTLIFPGLSKFFGLVAQAFPDKLLSNHGDILRCGFSAVDETDLNIYIPALELIGLIAYTPEGKAVLQRQDEKYMRHIMGRLHEAMSKLPTEWRIRAVHVLANIIHVETDRITNEITRVNEAWFNQLGTSGMSMLVTIARQPFPDLKAAAYLVLLNMANQRWGQYKINCFEGLMDFLLDRRTETDLEGHHMKYNILKAIIETDTADAILEPHNYEAIIDYVRQGPIFAPTVTEVAIEGAE
ncbi:26S proteasome non-ATPase regulatory subunit 5 [Halyomorpha halys]|uniref:26S proteasome non-ATPase regulatory subunit 5 n=1 Tax=Halyomorpha halys TaxID=286706 RepID=UPI0006D4FAF5|nr:26S proteasome non-ATPase regulatory subunit 5-like [Halyomorpha halys]